MYGEIIEEESQKFIQKGKARWCWEYLSMSSL